MTLAGLHQPKRAMDIPEQYAKTYFDMMPIHEKLRGHDFPALRSYLRVTMINIQQNLSDRLDAPAVIRSLMEARA
jgi:hypothetical protein